MDIICISGHVIDHKTKRGIKGLRVEAWDKDLIFDDLVSTAVTDEDGAFRIEFDESYFQELFLDRQPDLFFKMYRGDKLIKSTDDSVLWNVENGDTDVVIEIDDPDVEEMARKLDGGLRRLLRMTDDEILKAVEVQEAWRAEKKQQIDQLSEVLLPNASDEDIRAFEHVQRLYRTQLLPHPIYGALIIDTTKIEPIKTRAIVHFTGNRDDLTALGLEVRAQGHDIFTVVGTTKQLANLAAQPATLRMRLPRVLLPSVENATAQGAVSAVHKPRPANPSGYKGKDIIVGIIDTALDVTHHGFREPKKGLHGTRVLYYWVQTPYILQPTWYHPLIKEIKHVDTPPGRTPVQYHKDDPLNTPNFMGLDYGRIYTWKDINTTLALPYTSLGSSSVKFYGKGPNQICAPPSQASHGTHTAGIAAGSGHEFNWNKTEQHIGAAPKATIIHVCIGTHKGMSIDATFEDYVIDAIDFIFRAAKFHKMPAVVNVSLGTNLGPHNGADDFDQLRSNLLNSYQNRSLVFSAGNDNDDKGFRKGTITTGKTETLILTGVKNMGIWLDLWYTGPKLEFQIKGGKDSSGWIPVDKDYEGTLNNYDITVDRDVEPGGGLHNVRLYVNSAQTGDKWTINLRHKDASTAVQYYAWTGPQGKHATLDGASQNELTLSDTACAKAILTVGACDKLNPAVSSKRETIAPYSAAGPTLASDGRIKPEIVAVGTSVNSCKSDQKSGYTSKTGTSMAAPLVAGAVALLLEECQTFKKNLDQDTIKQLLAKHADTLGLQLDPKKPGFSQKQLNLYGNGRLRLLPAIDKLQPPVDVDVWVRTANDDFDGKEPYAGNYFWGAPDIRVYEAGTKKEVTRLTWGTTYNVQATVYNRGTDDAVDTTVRLRYTLPWTAPNKWHAAEDANDKPLQKKINIPALNKVVVTFQWRPQVGEIQNAPAGATHFCLLTEVDHVKDKLVYPAPTKSGGDAWALNIKGTNNVALRNVHIQK